MNTPKWARSARCGCVRANTPSTTPGICSSENTTAPEMSSSSSQGRTAGSCLEVSGKVMMGAGGAGMRSGAASACVTSIVGTAEDG